MNDDQDKIFSSINKMSLTSQERQAIRERLRALTSLYAPRDNLAISLWSFVSRHAVASLAVLVLLLAGGTTTLAGNSRPGDFLYPVRTQVNDKLSSAAAFTDDGKMDVELSQIDRDLRDENSVMEEMIRGEQENIAREEADVEKRLDDDGEIKGFEQELNQMERDLREEEDAQIDL
jgi:hypothetical protein